MPLLLGGGRVVVCKNVKPERSNVDALSFTVESWVVQVRQGLLLGAPASLSQRPACLVKRTGSQATS